MAVNLSMLAGAGAQFFDNNGIPLAGGLIYTYAAGTTTPQATYTSSSGSTAHSNPIVLNSAGRVASGGEIWLTDAVSYKFVLQTSAAVTIATYDNVTGNSSGIYAAFATSSGSSLVGYIQNGTGAVATTVQARLRQQINVKDFGATGNGSTNDTTAVQNAYNAVKAAGGGVLFFPVGTYLCNITGGGSDNVSMLGTGTASILKSWTANAFAVSIGGSYPSYGYFFKDLVFSDVSHAKTTHGLYLNVGSDVCFENVTFTGLGIGLCLNGTIENTFFRCNFTYCYVGVFDTTSTGANTSITNVNGQTVTITDAFKTIQPGLQGFYDCFWYVCNIAYYFEQPNNSYNTNGALKFIGGAMEGCSVGAYLSTYAFHPCLFDGMWFENTYATQPLRSLTLPATAIYSAGGNVNIKNTVISDITAATNSIITVEDCDVIQTPNFTTTDNGAILCKNILGDNVVLTTYCDGGRNFAAGRFFIFYTTPKVVLSRPFSDFLAFSNPCTAAYPVLTGYGSPTITRITSNSVFSPTEAQQVVMINNDGIRSPAYTINNAYVYVMTFTAKSTGSSITGIFTSNTVGGTITITSSFRTFAEIITTTNTGSDTVIFINKTGSTATMIVSGWQMLAFPDYEQANEFLKSSSFNVT